MTLQEFKGIFFWEYVHRLLGRIIGIVFLLPFLLCWARGYFDNKLFRRMLLLFGLGALQGVMGWVTVKSGLVDNPSVSHYRLAVHLILAFMLVGFCAWYALDIQRSEMREKKLRSSSFLKNWGIAIGIVFVFQLVWGALTAGLDAGLIYNTFPLMNGNWMPRQALVMQPLMLNLIDNPGTVQWVHRVLGTVLALLVAGLWVHSRIKGVDKGMKWQVPLLLGIIFVQYLLGILTLIYQVPVALGVIHQAVAMIFWLALILFYHRLKNRPAL